MVTIKRLPTLEVSKKVYKLMMEERKANPLIKWIDLRQRGLDREHFVHGNIVVLEGDS